MHTPKLWYVKGLGLERAKTDLLGDIREKGRVERWGHRAEIHHRDEPSEVYVVLRGSIDVQDGAHDVVLRLRPGDVYGETGETDAEPGHRARVQAFDDTTISALDRAKFDELTGSKLGRLVAPVGIVRRQTVGVPASMLLYTTPQRRLAKILLHLVETYGDVDDDHGRLSFGLKSRNLARVSGLAPRSVSDIFDAMQRERVVEVGRTELVIPSLDLMRELAIGERYP